jgi:pimeloyl-ACP methyl ester carboxylesterase
MKNLKFLIEKSSRFITSNDDDEKKELYKELEKQTSNFQEIIKNLKSPVPQNPETGLLKNRPFKKKKFHEKHSDKLMSLFVPDNYNYQKPSSLLIFLHGGGHSTPSDAGARAFETYGIRDLLTEGNFIVCAPCAPHTKKFFRSWHTHETDEYLVDIIEEVASFYNIDNNRVFLAGTSMGGMGTLHHAQRNPDRFAGLLASASSWDLGFWSGIIGTKIWILQGTNDSVMFRRRHGTDISYSRLLRERLEEAGAEYYYREHSGGHSICDGRRILSEWLDWAKNINIKRDPFFPHVVNVSPCGCTTGFNRELAESELGNWNLPDEEGHNALPAPSLHNRWVTIDEIGDETLTYDWIKTSGCRDDIEDDWRNFNLTLSRKQIKGGLVEASIRNKNNIEVTPKNVTEFTLWLHPKMVDLQNLRIMVKGQLAFKGALQPNLAVLLESYCRSRDWEMTYPAKITIKGNDSWKTADQIKIIK